MKESIYKNYEELPLFLNAKTMAQVLGISTAWAYELMHSIGFPVLKIGSRWWFLKKISSYGSGEDGKRKRRR